MSQSVHLPNDATEVFPRDQSSLSVELVHVCGMVTRTIHHGYAAAKCQTSVRMNQVNVCECKCFKGTTCSGSSYFTVKTIPHL